MPTVDQAESRLTRSQAPLIDADAIPSQIRTFRPGPERIVPSPHGRRPLKAWTSPPVAAVHVAVVRALHGKTAKELVRELVL